MDDRVKYPDPWGVTYPSSFRKEAREKFGKDIPLTEDKCLKCGRPYKKHFGLTCYEERPDLKPYYFPLE